MGLAPQVQTSDRNINQLQQGIAQSIRLWLKNPLLQGVLLNGISIATGTNTINHGLGRVLQGWIIVGINGDVTIYDQQASNKTPNLTLILVSTGGVTANLYVF